MANPWEIDWANQQAPAPQSMSGGIVIRPGDPNRATLTQLEIEQKRQALASNAADEARKRTQFNERNNPKPSDIKPLLTAKERADAIQQYRSAQDMSRQIEELEKLYAAGPGATSGVTGIQDYLNLPANQTFDDYANQLRGPLKQALGMTGGENNTAAEGAQNLGGYIPQSANYDQNILQKIKSLRDLQRESSAKAVAILGGVPDQNGVIKPAATVAAQDSRKAIPSYTPPTGAPPNEGGNGIPTLSPSQEVEIKKLAPTMTTQAMQKWFKDRRMPISAANAQGIYDYYRKEGPNAPPPSFAYDDSKYNAYLDERNAAQDAQFGKEGNYSLGVNQLMAGAAPLIAGATQGVGSALRGEGFAPGYQIGRDQSMRRFQQARDAAGIPGMVSEGLGMAGGMLATGAATGAQKFLPRLGADVLFGATSGAIQAKPGEETQGALQGSLGAGLGNVGGHVVGTGLGKALTGARDVGVDYLRARGVPLTIGQALGGKWKAREDKLTSFLPSIGERRAEGLSSFRDAAYEDMGAPVGYKPSQLGMNGNAVMDESRLAVGPAYDAATAGRMFDANEPQFVQGAGQALAQGRAIPGELGDRFAGMEKARVAPFIDEQGGLSGPNFQAILRGVRKETSSALPEPRGDLFANASRGLQEELRGLVERQAPDVLPKFDAANQFYQNRSILRDAVTAAKNTNGDWLPSQLGNAVNANVRKFGGKDLAASESRPFYQLQKHGQNILPSKIADSGTAGRLGALAPLALPAIGVGTGGATGYAGGDTGAGTATGLGTALTMAMLSTKAGQKAAVKLLVGRPDKMVGMGQKLLSKRAVASALGGGSLGAALIGRQ